MRHTNPYKIRDEKNIFEVGENSSHPELQDCKRIWYMNGYTFRTATELEKYMRSEGFNPKSFWIKPEWQDREGETIIAIKVVQRVPEDERGKVLPMEDYIRDGGR